MLFFRFYAALTGLLHGNHCFFARRSPFFGNPIIKYTKIDTGLQPGHQYLNIKQYVPRLFASFPRLLFAAVALYIYIHLLIQMHINRNQHFSFSHDTFLVFKVNGSEEVHQVDIVKKMTHFKERKYIFRIKTKVQKLPEYE